MLERLELDIKLLDMVWMPDLYLVTITIINSFLTPTGTFSVVIGTLVYVFGSCERHYEPTKEMRIALRPIAEGGTLWSFV